MSEIIIGLETLRALLEKSENHASLDEWGNMRPDVLPLKVAGNLFSKIYPRFIEIMQLIGASGMITLPTEQSFHSPIRKDLDQYLQSATKPAYDRVKIFRLAWDLSMSAFGTRQTQYERYFLVIQSVYLVIFISVILSMNTLVKLIIFLNFSMI